ncbi:MAG TPA: 5'-3' exonuclease H3TH domain-containing protein [Dokdonella sp.]|uniref:5'-3' exonuclease n=1 Tax=Dokdonella sp. TaxID=2291710 RepID=UPI0025C65507|nr:5'-3' exonuclease H3TH domain-containing protein [Dokdonella sp.]MBX3691937.1 exodeoxyribonuclease IX [Dokdonella sp.]MCW5567421.1 exodeoxyribonuclease IX [Dokdonella sp.]HNR91874.1 5'-3' exonuclease H3TH domain-containing protein [Dokdonella sp.]
MPDRVYLVDASLYVFRAWHSIPPDFTDIDGHPVNAVHGFTRFLLDLLERVRPGHAAIAFDESLTGSFRNAIYPAYKANRELPPAELVRQFDYCREVAAALGLTVLTDRQYEADDLIGSAVACLARHDRRVVIVSADKDFGQLVGDQVEQWDFSRDQRWDAHGVRQRLGVKPEQVADYLALTGDAIDNIPGVPGIGAKTAATLLAHFGSLDTLLARADEVAFLRLRGAAATSARLREHADIARLSRALTGIAVDAPVPASVEAYARRAHDWDAVETLFDRLRIGPMTRARVRGLAG